MHANRKQMAQLGMISAILLMGVSPSRAADLTVDNLNVNKDTMIRGTVRIDGRVGIGVANSGADLQINQTGLGVGIFLGNRAPFGQALFETDLTAPATHAWFAENGERVFSVIGGGTGFFKGALVVGADAAIEGKMSIGSDARLVGNLTIGDPSTLTGSVTIWGGNLTIGNPLDGRRSVAIVGGDVSFGAEPRQMINLWHTAYGIGVQDFAFYQRTGKDFFWYKDGSHSKNFGDSGGGTKLMHLDGTGALTAFNRVVTPVLEITGGTDVAEPFQMSRGNIPKGAVVSIDEEDAGHLKISESAYDKRVAGIVSGANGINPGISLSQQGVTEGGQNVALSGRVYALADASKTPIKPGDLLTTSDTPGHAMRATDHTRAQGAVIGKAMSALNHGKGMVLVLVTLQ